MKSLICIVFLVCSLTGNTQTIEDVWIKDTNYVDNDTVIIFSDNSWQLLRNISNIEELIPPVKENGIDTAFYFSTNWNNNRTYQKGINLYNMKDSFQIHVLGVYNETPVFPINNTVTSTFKIRWGKMHQGIDIKASVGTPVKASFSGKVRYAKMNSGGYGNLIIIRHHNGLETYCAHLSKMMVKPNQYVKAGDIIGYSGNSGHSTGPHLHYEIRFCENAINPEMIWDISDYSVKRTELLIDKKLFAYKNRTHKEVSVNKYINNAAGKPKVEAKKKRVRNKNAYYGNMGD